MSRLAELIEQLCPDGVEYRPLGEVADLQRGSGMPKKLFVDEGIPAIHYGHIFTKYGIHTKCAAAYLAPEDADKLTRVYPGDLVVANTSENLEDVGKGVVWLGEAEGVTGGHATVVRSLAVDTVFLSYYLRTEDFALKKRKYSQGTKVVELSAANLSKIDIPVPPLAVQREIVRILDQFTTLEAELEAELEARRTQYEHYRNHLLSYESLAARGPVEMVKLGDMLEMRAGNSISSKYIFERSDSEHIYPCYGANGVRGYVRSMTHEHDASIIGRQGALCGNVTYADGPFFATEHAVVVSPRVELSQRWLYHALIVANLSQYATKSAQPGLSVRRVAEVEIPVPRLSEQYRIADLLDGFDALVNDITSGLPAEIASRRAQYEHYRDRLLSFPEKKAE
ncbi:restriction endonuclease subunit S [Sanguibacter keddieii]|jgi:type I restriction enzyme specificity protein hsdS|uniref:restriction endonuclease subunit S n=1 Tax=Sanguibacter keddieii TaxID=60920 RepID=UPI00065FA6BA|nr:restriction endonuclease subunit S [Sanguibacter keddieii]